MLAAYVSYSATSNIIYVDGDSATLSDIKYLVSSAPLTLVNAGAAIWKLDANIRIINGGNEIMLHREIDFSVVEGNVTEGNVDSGIAVFDSRDNVIANNVSRFNLHGIRFTMGAANNFVEGNEFSENLDQGIKFFKGNDPPRPGDDGRPKNNTFTGNLVADNGGYGIRARDTDSNTFENNQILNNGGDLTVLLEFSANNTFRDNEVTPGTMLKVRGGSSLSSSLFVSGQDLVLLDIDQYSTVTFSDTDGAIFALYDEHGESAAGDVNLVNGAGSTLVVTSALTGIANDATVATIPLQVAVSGGTATVEPIDGATAFLLQASPPTVAVNLIFDQLAAGNDYELSKNGSAVASGTADGGGSLQFSQVPGATSAFLFELESIAAPLTQSGGMEREAIFANNHALSALRFPSHYLARIARSWMRDVRRESSKPSGNGSSSARVGA